MYLDLYYDSIAISDCYNERTVLKNKLDARWNYTTKCWEIPISSKSIEFLKKTFNATVSAELANYMSKETGLYEQTQEIKEKKNKPLVYNFQKYIKNATLMEHQQIAGNIAMMLFNAGHSGVMFDMEMGTGKTMATIAVIGELEAKRILVVCPKISLRVWADEYRKFANYDYDLATLSGPAKKRVETMQDLVDNERDGVKSIAVINYEYVKPFEKILAEWHPDIIVCDESHKIKSPSSLQTKAITKLGYLAKYRFCLTGTPLTNNVLDFFSQYKFLDATIFGSSYTSFKNKYVITGMYDEYLRPNPVNLPELKYKLNTISYRVTKEECLDLPPYSDIYVNVDFEPETMDLYREFEKEFVVWLNGQDKITAQNALTKTLKLRQLTGGFCYDVSNPNVNKKVIRFDSSKLNACEDLISSIVREGNKVIVFAEFQAEIEAIANMCEKIHVDAVTYYGNNSDKEKDRAYNRFVNGDAMVFIGQIESAGISITLTNAKYTIFYSTGYKYGAYDQARSRMHRKGQTSNCTYYHLIVNNTIDEKINKALDKKERLAETIIDSYKKE